MTPRFAIVPYEPTQAMSDALVCEPIPPEFGFAADYQRMIAASPNAGRLGAEALERAVAAVQERFGVGAEDHAIIRAAFEAAGIGVEGGAE